MNRRRLTYGCLALTLIGGAIAAWFVLARRDADFVMVGPKTKGVRDNFVKLDMMIDSADFQDCKTVRQAVRQLNRKLNGGEIFPDDQQRFGFWLHNQNRLRVDNDAFTTAGKDLIESPFQLPAESQPMALKQFLRMTFAQTGVPEVSFIVRGHYIEATTSKRAQEERTQYLDSVSVYDRMRNLWKEMRGDLADDPPEFMNVW